MALLWIDGFEGYLTTGSLTAALIGRRYPSSSQPTQMSIQSGRIAGYSLQMAGNLSAMSINSPALTTDATLIIGVAVKPASFPLTDLAIISFYDVSTLGVNLRLSSGGELSIYRGTTLLATTTTLSLSNNAWYYIEMKVVCGASGSYEVRVDNTVVLTDASENTKAGTHDYHDRFILQTVTNITTTFDDMYVCDGSGGINDDFLGNCKVVAINPDNDSSVNWSTVYPALSDHYADVDDGATADDDTTYVEDATTGHRDLFTYAAVSGTLTSIYGLAVYNTCRVTDANSVDIKTVVSNNGSETVSTAQTISSTSYLTTNFICQLDPDTNGVWDIDTINDVEYGFEVG
jgi:hypothetical protein